RVDAAPRPRPRLVTRIAHRDTDAQAGIRLLQIGDLLPEDEITRRTEPQDQGDPARPADAGEVARDAHHRRDADPRADQDDALRLLPGEHEGAVRCLDLDLVSRLQLVVQPG